MILQFLCALPVYGIVTCEVTTLSADYANTFIVIQGLSVLSALRMPWLLVGQACGLIHSQTHSGSFCVCVCVILYGYMYVGLADAMVTRRTGMWANTLPDTFR